MDVNPTLLAGAGAGHRCLQDAAATASKHKQDVQWLMQDHRRELAEAHRKNQELIQDTQQLRMRVLELEQQLWGGAAAPAAPAAQAASAAAPAGAAAVDAEAQAAAAALVVQQQEQLELLQTATLQLTQEKQQLMKNLQVGLQSSAVLFVVAVVAHLCCGWS